jgi:murein DD-endopeptidase MepM/ murein hydrolase activator NlpD
MNKRTRHWIIFSLLTFTLFWTILIRPPPSVSNPESVENTPSKLETTPWQYAAFPVTNFQRYSSPFGMRLHPLSGTYRMHKGQDIAAPEGSDIVAWWGGKVIQVGFDKEGWGNYLVVLSGKWEYLYAHCSKILVKQGAIIETNAVIATIGRSGGVTGPHLHWELRHQTEQQKQKGIVDSSQWELVNPAKILWLMYQAKYPDQKAIQPTSFSGEGSRNEIIENY